MHTLLLVIGDGIDDQLVPFAGWGDNEDNPEAKFDWYEIGGRWKGFLQLRAPRLQKRLFGFLAPRKESRTNTARKHEIDSDALLADPPAAVLFRGQWHEGPIQLDGPPDVEWASQFRNIYNQIPDDAQLTIVDIHS
jgi:hypothetical protein